jgi:16S rRNA (guanine527-N7)-methyltransferase
LSDAAAARRELDRLLQTDAQALRATLPVGYGDRVERYVGLLLDANARQNLTRIVEPDAVARLHLLDALSALPLLHELAPRRALELGSGGGVPGIVLALARPSVAWTLVDSARRKADALSAFVDTLALANVEVIAERAEVLGHDPRHRGKHDMVIARACAALPVLLEYALPLVRVGGAVLAWKGAVADAEMTAGRTAAALLGGGALDVRETGIRALGGHRLVLIRKRGPTPERYPRRPGEPARRPLA